MYPSGVGILFTIISQYSLLVILECFVGSQKQNLLQITQMYDLGHLYNLYVFYSENNLWHHGTDWLESLCE